ncbi:cytochrome c [Seonamhaeicola sediminis]|uniref:Cytochrome c n=1 Tax=Seonamhaeicola sediminis TaxID=2528206 RepID=A0A562YCR4_9FLAO|nr:cytochrome c [Seonamhaeicola sediminis]TWO31877.1 cytochrome c [Seonamhaeicola sediminis]
MKTKHLLYILGFSILLFACSSSSSDDLTGQNPDPNPNPDPDPDPTAKVTYKDDIKGIIDGNCISCHGSPTNGPSNSLHTYNLVKNDVDKIIDRINRTGAGKMPPNGTLSNSAKALIQQWKDDGLLEE